MLYLTHLLNIQKQSQFINILHIKALFFIVCHSDQVLRITKIKF